MKIKLPGRGLTEIDNIVFDFNGTLAKNSKLTGDAKDLIEKFQSRINIYIATSDIFGNVKDELKDLKVNIIDTKTGAEKLAFIMKLGYTKTIAVGNGNNDILMLKKAVVGICINGLDGTTPECVSNSNIVINDVKNIVNLLENENLILSILQKWTIDFFNILIIMG